MNMKQEQDRYLVELTKILEDSGFRIGDDAIQNGIELQVFGSVAINGDGNDIDYLLYVPYNLSHNLRDVFRNEGYQVNSSYGIDNDGWGSVKKDDLYNVIIYTDRELHLKQVAAFDHCCRMQSIAGKPMPKVLRRAIHEYLRSEFDEPEDYRSLLSDKEKAALAAFESHL